MNKLHRRTFLSLVAGFTATPGFAAANPTSAVAVLQRIMPPGDVTGLIITDINGAPVQLSAYSNRIIVLNLWASWCQPCRREMPSLSRLANQIDPARISVLPLAFERGGAAPVKRFFKDIAVSNLPILLGNAQNLQTVLGRALLPTTLILNKMGQHIYTAKGEARWDDAQTLKWLNYLADQNGFEL